jgi:hypothetical protein
METTETQQASPMMAEPEDEHRWLQRLKGEWTYEGEAAAPGGLTQKASGTETVRSLGDVWVIAEGRGEMPGGAPAMTIMTLGYDPQKKRFVGAWIGSMMANLWVYDGWLEGYTLTLESDGPSNRSRSWRNIATLSSSRATTTGS